MLIPISPRDLAATINIVYYLYSLTSIDVVEDRTALVLQSTAATDAQCRAGCSEVGRGHCLEYKFVLTPPATMLGYCYFSTESENAGTALPTGTNFARRLWSPTSLTSQTYSADNVFATSNFNKKSDYYMCYSKTRNGVEIFTTCGTTATSGNRAIDGSACKAGNAWTYSCDDFSQETTQCLKGAGLVKSSAGVFSCQQCPGGLGGTTFCGLNKAAPIACPDGGICPTTQNVITAWHANFPGYSFTKGQTVSTSTCTACDWKSYSLGGQAKCQGCNNYGNGILGCGPTHQFVTSCQAGYGLTNAGTPQAYCDPCKKIYSTPTSIGVQTWSFGGSNVCEICPKGSICNTQFHGITGCTTSSPYKFIRNDAEHMSYCQCVSSASGAKCF